MRAGPKPTKQGFLDKLSGGKHKAPKWDNRYFELTETGYLYYYKKPDGGKPINSIYLRGCPVEIDQNDSCIIIVKSEERDWNLKAVNPGEASAWKDALSFYTGKQNWKKKKDHLGMARSLNSIYRGCRPECEQMVRLFFSENMYNLCT